MITFNSDSWHCRFVHWMDEAPRENLCPYVRQVLRLLATIIFMGALSGGVIATVLYTVGSLLVWIVSMILTTSLIYPDPPTAIGGIFVLFLALLYGWDFCSKWVSDHDILCRSSNRIPGAPDLHQSSLFSEWLKAKHDKFCPRIEFVEKTESKP